MPRIAFLKPVRPSLFKYIIRLSQVWRSGVFTNFGKQHERFEDELKMYLGTESLALCTNGTQAQVTLMKLLASRTGKREVITTPYSFISSAASIINAGLTPVFVDIDDKLSLDVRQVESAISKETLGILSVDVYGIPNNCIELNKLARSFDICHIGDKSHSFGVTILGNSSLLSCDYVFASMHATKIMSAIEGGLIINNSGGYPSSTDMNNYNNFGFEDDDSIVLGINGKMDELRAAFGRLCLANINSTVEKRKLVFEEYLKQGLEPYIYPTYLELHKSRNTELNYSYLPIIVHPNDRPTLLERLKANDIIIKVYFDRVIPSYTSFSNSPQLWKIESTSQLKNAYSLSKSVVTLPLHQKLSRKDIRTISQIVRMFTAKAPFTSSSHP